MRQEAKCVFGKLFSKITAVELGVGGRNPDRSIREKSLNRVEDLSKWQSRIVLAYQRSDSLSQTGNFFLFFFAIKKLLMRHLHLIEAIESVELQEPEENRENSKLIIFFWHFLSLSNPVH